MSTRLVAAAIVLATVHMDSAAHAQSIGARLSTLLTEQQPVGNFVLIVSLPRYHVATVAGLFTVEFATLPVSSSSGGFVLSPESRSRPHRTGK